jgi:3D (Asp-Asp-Asp) domain-containing protein
MAEANNNVRRDETPSTVTTTAPVRTPAPSSPRTGRQLTVKAYAYALRGTTATGIRVAPGVIAVDPRVIPLGTRLYVPGYGEGIAADTGGDIKGNTIDVWMSSAQAASDWGIKRITITVYD